MLSLYLREQVLIVNKNFKYDGEDLFPIPLLLKKDSMIRQIKAKDKKKFIYYCQKQDKYNDFYITKNNNRLFLNDSKHATLCVNQALKKGNKIFIAEENNEIIGVMLILGYADKMPRKYLQILSDNDKVTKNLLKYLFWTIDLDVYIKIKSNNPLKRILEKNYFEKIVTRDNEVLYIHKRFLKRIKKDGNRYHK